MKREIYNVPVNELKVCVVGGAGFLGSHLVDYLIKEKGCEVTVIDNLCAGKLEFVNSEADFIHHDITGSEDYLRQIFQTKRISYVFNYAAYPYVPDSFARPLHVFNVNAFGALKVINAANEAGCLATLQVSSAEIYGEGYQMKGASQESYAEFKMDEDSPVIPHSSYGASKAAIDAMVQVRWRESKVRCLALRQFNCVGERDVLHPYVIPHIIGALYRWGPMVHLGNNSTRDFLYAGDAVKMAVELIEKGSFGQVYNLGSQESINIYPLAQLIGKLMGHEKVDIIEDETRKRPWEIWHLQSDNKKIYEVIDSRPEVPLKEALKRTIDDYTKRLDDAAGIRGGNFPKK